MRIYVASSWRNMQQPLLVQLLREHGHYVYDFKNPSSGDMQRQWDQSDASKEWKGQPVKFTDSGFSWEELDPDWKNWTADQYVAALNKPIAQRGYDCDMAAMHWADACVLVLPSGRSAHLEAGWFAGKEDRILFILTRDGEEPELMAKMANVIVTSPEKLVDAIAFHQW